MLSDPGCEMVKDQKKITVARLTVEIDGQAQAIYIKRYNMYSWRHRLVSPMASSGAFRALRGAAILQRAGIPMARPVAAVEQRRWGALLRSFFVTEELAGGRTADAYWREVLRPAAGRQGIARRREFIIQLARLFRALHSREIYHNDLKDFNIIVSSNAPERQLRLSLLDLEGVKQYRRLSPARRQKNLVQINRTLGSYLRVCDKLLFLKVYMERAYFDRRLRRQLIDAVARQSRRLDAAKAAQLRAA